MHYQNNQNDFSNNEFWIHTCRSWTLVGGGGGGGGGGSQLRLG